WSEVVPLAALRRITFARRRCGCRRSPVVQFTQLRLQEPTQPSPVLPLDRAQLLDLLTEHVLLGVEVVHLLGVLALSFPLQRRGLVPGLPLDRLSPGARVVEHRLGTGARLVDHRVRL